MANETLSIILRAVGATQAAGDVKKVDTAIGRLTSHAGQGLRTAASNIAKIGVVAAGVIGSQVYEGIKSLETLESATTSVDAAIKAMGRTGQITSQQVADWSNQIEASIGAAFDDKDITRATATLIRFGKVTPENLHESMQVMTDLAAKTGDVDSAASLLAKALVDPTKAAGKLARVGVVLTKTQQDQVKALVKAGETEKAQKLILDALAQTTAGAAAATQGPYARAMSVLKDTTEDAQRALAEGFLPVIERVASVLSNKLAQPGTIDSIRSFGQGLASAFDQVLDAASKIPWGSIADAMKLAGTGARAALDFFTQLPPWVQTAVLTGWGLNKLTGGALGSIVGELGKGLIKGVLGMNAGVVNINAAVVNGGGGGVNPGNLAGDVAGGAAVAEGAGAAGAVSAGTMAAVLVAPLAVALAPYLITALMPRNPANFTGTPTPLSHSFAGGSGSQAPRLAPIGVVNVVDNSPGAREEREAAKVSATWNAATAQHTEALNAGITTSAEKTTRSIEKANALLRQIEAKREENRINVLTRVSTYVTNRVTVGGINKTQTTYRQYQSGGATRFAL